MMCIEGIVELTVFIISYEIGKFIMNIVFDKIETKIFKRWEKK